MFEGGQLRPRPRTTQLLCAAGSRLRAGASAGDKCCLYLRPCDTQCESAGNTTVLQWTRMVIASGLKRSVQVIQAPSRAFPAHAPLSPIPLASVTLKT